MRKSCILHIRVTPETKKAIERRAKKEKRTVSNCAALILESAVASRGDA